METFEQRAERLALHEAAHFILAKDLGFKPKKIAIHIKENQWVDSGSADMSLDSGIVDPKIYAENRIKILLAGVFGECLNHLIKEIKDDDDKKDNLEAVQDHVGRAISPSGSGYGDSRKAFELICLLENISPTNGEDFDTRCNASLQQYLMCTAVDVRRLSRGIRAVADALKKKLVQPGKFDKLGSTSELSEKEVVQILARLSN